MADSVFVLSKVTWDGPECYKTVSELTERVCVFWTKEEANKAMRKLASLEYPEMEFQESGSGCIEVSNGDVWSSGIRYEILRLPFVSYQEFLRRIRMTEFIKYKWTHTFDSASEAVGTVLRFYAILRENPDYVKSKIYLYMDGSTVTLVKFYDSKTHVRVELNRAGDFSIKLFGDLKTRK